MDAIKIHGYVNERHELSAEVPDSIPPGPVSILIVPHLAASEPAIDQAPQDDWPAVISHAWAEDLGDVRQDIYTLDDGEPPNGSQ